MRAPRGWPSNMGNVRARALENASAVALFERALQRFEEAGDRERTANALVNLAIVRDHMGETAVALDLFSRRLRYFEETGMCRSNMGGLYHAHGGFAKALSCHERALELAAPGATLTFLAAFPLRSTYRTSSPSMTSHARFSAPGPNASKAWRGWFRYFGSLAMPRSIFVKSTKLPAKRPSSTQGQPRAPRPTLSSWLAPSPGAQGV